MRLDLRDRARPERWRKLRQEPACLADGDIGFLFGLNFGDIVLGDSSKRVRRCDTFGDTAFALNKGRIAARLSNLAPRVTGCPRIFQADFGISTKSEILFLAVNAIL